MTEKIIDFKTAKLAKKKGFNITSWFGNDASLYCNKGKHVYYSNYGMMGSGLSDGYIKAATQSLLQKWLREEHNIETQSIFNTGLYRRLRAASKLKVNNYRINIIMTSDSHYTEYSDNNNYKTYEEALEKALIKGLKLI